MTITIIFADAVLDKGLHTSTQNCHGYLFKAKNDFQLYRVYTVMRTRKILKITRAYIYAHVHL